MEQRVEVQVWNHEDLIEAGRRILAEGGSADAPLIDGRVIWVHATPENGSASKMAIGLAVLPPGCATPAHRHEAEELATVLAGDGLIVIDGVEHPVRQGSVVLTPSQSEHVTKANGEEPLVIWWVYAPAGSEQRWLTQEAEG